MTTAAAASNADERVAEQLLQMVLKRLEQDRLVLPPISTVATRALDMVNKPDFSVQRVAELLETDPILATRVLRVVNSAALAGKQPCTNIQAAITRLGSRQLRSVIVDASVGSVFESRDQRIAQATKGLWQHSVAVAMLSRDIGILLGSGDPEDSYLAGLLHDVGKPVLAILLLEAEKQASLRTTSPWIGSDLWVKVLQRSHRQVGVALAKKWQLPGHIVKAIEDCADYDSDDRKSIANLVRFSNAVAKQQGLYVGAFDAEDINALVMIGRSLLGIEDEALVRLASGLKDKVMGRFKA
jgi:putative nucleotidyltransferase with HDIG domain